MEIDGIKVPKDRYICESKFDEEFDLVMYNEENDQYGLQADSTSWDKMIAFSTALADKPEDWYRHLWTSFDGDNGTLYLVNGTRYVDRMDFFFTKQPWGIDNNKPVNDATMIEVAWEDQDDCEEGK